MRKTKIICTIGPASQSPEKIREMIQEGMNVCRCNFSHGSYEEQKAKLINVVKISEEMGIPVDDGLLRNHISERLRPLEHLSVGQGQGHGNGGEAEEI